MRQKVFVCLKALYECILPTYEMHTSYMAETMQNVQLRLSWSTYKVDIKIHTKFWIKDRSIISNLKEDTVWYQKNGR